MLSHPYTALTPDTVLDALAQVGLYGDGRLLALNSFENRVYQAHLDEPCQGHGVVVLKFYRPERWTTAQILEEHAFAAELAAAEVPMVAPLVLQGRTLHEHAGFAFSVSPRRGGRQPELDDAEVLEWTGRLLGRLHAVGARQPFAHRPTLNLHTFGTAACQLLQAAQALPLEVMSAWLAAYEEASKIIASHPYLTRDGNPNEVDNPYHTRPIRLHGDCHPGNILWTESDGPHFVDLDDARSGPAVQDLWMLISGDRRQRSLQLATLLDGYEQVRDFDRRELALIEPLRTLRLVHYSAWLASRWQDPIFPQTFPWFGSRDYWQGQVDMLHEQIEAMQEDPLVV